jgi:hypothetical protein
MGLSRYWRIQHTLNSYTSQMACCLFVTEEMNGANLSVFWLQSRLVQEFLFQTTSHLSWPLNLTLIKEATVQCCFRPNSNILLVLSYRDSIWKRVESESVVYTVTRRLKIKSDIVPYKDYWLQGCIYSHDDAVLQSCQKYTSPVT